MSKFTHFTAEGAAHMVDVGAKPASARRAIAHGRIHMQAATLAAIQAGEHKKGDVLAIARVAAIMAAKKTAELIPLCHAIPLHSVEIDFVFEAQPPAIQCAAQVATVAQTGVEMEALTAVQIALLTIYDMCKSTDRGMLMTDIGLALKSGGKSGEWRRA